MRRRQCLLGAIVGLALAGAPNALASRPLAVGYASPAALRGLDVVERVAPLRVAEVSGVDAATLRRRPGIAWVHAPVRRAHEGARLTFAPRAAASAQWAYSADRENLVPASVARAASAITIAVVDTGADLRAPALAAKAPVTFDVITNDAAVSDDVGHGTFVASVAAGFGGDAQLMVVQANRTANTFTDVDEAAGIVWAVDHGAQIVNLSIGGTQTSQVEKDAINYAIAHGVLLVAAAGNDAENGDQPSYPAALLGPRGLSVAASTVTGSRAVFSTTARYVSLAAPGVGVLGATTASASRTSFPRATVTGTGGIYAFGTGTSYAAPQVAGAAALVWAANPALSAEGVMHVLEHTARGSGRWNARLGWGILDVAAAVARASALN